MNCSVKNCTYEANEVYNHYRFGPLCENHHIDLCYLPLYASGKIKIPEYPRAGLENDCGAYAMANRITYKKVNIEELPEIVQKLIKLGFKLAEIPTSVRDQKKLLEILQQNRKA